MLSGNLATRPFYNERLVRVLLAGALAAAAAWAAVNASARERSERARRPSLKRLLNKPDLRKRVELLGI
jgi:hypothetical protein